MNKKAKVFVGVSGGVDSSVALALLQKDGYDVTGVFLKVWHPEWMPCDWKEERRSAMRVCATLGVPFITMDCESEYKTEVVDYMIREYSAGRVPNPDVFCNKYVKFGVFLKKALEMGADYVATGHYARVYEYKNKTNQRMATNRYELREAEDKDKDQSYFLYTLNQEQLAHTLFPIGHLPKTEVRKLAKSFGLSTATKKDSQGLCFIGKVDMKDFLSHYIDTKKGDVLNIKGETIGTHDGAMFYTIGQRHGFNITKKSNNDPKFFIYKKDIEKNTITVVEKNDDLSSDYSVSKIILNNIHFISEVEPSLPLNISARVRYRQEKQDCVIEKNSGFYDVVFSKPQFGVATGQSVVFYDKDICIGGGIIEKTMSAHQL
jgi:tRNA-uridine 2-sulfurtransferase